MTTLLIATDFSDPSKNASFYGMRLAEQLGATVVLLHVYPFVIPTAETAILMCRQELHRRSSQQLKREAKWLNRKKSVKVIRRSEQGNPGKTILSVAKEVNAGWIIAGTTGVSGISRVIFGSTSIFLGTYSQVPVMLIPEFAWFKIPKIIALASSLDNNLDPRIVDPLIAISNQYNSDALYIVKVLTEADEDKDRRIVPDQLKAYLRKVKPSYAFLNSNKIVCALQMFVKEKHINILAIISREHTTLEKWFGKSNLQEFITRSEVPIVVLPGKMIQMEALQVTGKTTTAA